MSIDIIMIIIKETTVSYNYKATRVKVHKSYSIELQALRLALDN